MFSFSTLRTANTLRLPQFKNSRGEPAHSKPDGSDWSLGEWMNAIIGEVGEAANLVKKIRRGDLTLDAARNELAKEFADIVTYADITAFQCGVPLVLHIENEGDHPPETVEMVPILSFNQLREADIQISKLYPNRRSLGELMNVINSKVGSIGDMAERIRVGHYALNLCQADIQQKFGLMLGYIDMACLHSGIDLGYQVLSKFNEVSRRVGADVFINEDDFVIDQNGSRLS